MSNDISTDRTFDWRPYHDPRSRRYPIRTFLPLEVDRSISRFWKASHLRLDQGSEGACVGFGWTAEALAHPRAVKLGNNTKPEAEKFAIELYRDAQEVDEWEGEDYSGTSVLAGAKIFVEHKLAEGYRWAFGIDDVIDALCASYLEGGGPVVIGIPWYESMYQTLPNGMVNVDRNSRLVGGHCILLTGWHPNMRFGGFNNGWKYLEVVKWRNSWGENYGKNGDGYISPEDLEWLLSRDGEACVPVQRKMLQ